MPESVPSNLECRPLEFERMIGRVSQPIGTPEPNGVDVGRECHAWTEREDAAFRVLESEARRMFMEANIEESGYQINTDAAGNMYITYFGEDPTKTVICGSHLDSVEHGGLYDGVAGVAAALEYLERMLKASKKPAFSYTVISFRAEESSPRRFELSSNAEDRGEPRFS